MGEPVNISLGYRSNPARNKQVGSAKLINCFAEETGDDAKVQIIITAKDGETAFGGQITDHGIRAMIDVDGTLYVVAGQVVYAVNGSGVSTLVGGIAATGPVYLARNRRIPAQIGLVCGGLYYVIDTLANTITLIEDPDLPPPIDISIIDGFGVLPVAGGKFFLTGLDDFTTIDPLDFATAEAFPDEIVRSVVLEKELIIMGATSLEWWSNTGGADFPLTRVHALELGCLSGPSVSIVDTPTRKTVIWVCPDHTVRMMNGYGGDVISTNDIEELIKDLHVADRIGELKGFAWAANGRFFYALTCEGWTKVYNAKTGFWVDFESYGIDRWRISDVRVFGNKVVAGDFEVGQLYTLSNKVFTDNGEHKVMKIITPPVSAFPYQAIFNSIFIDAASGVGLNMPSDAHAYDPKIMVRWSDDGNVSWSASRERSLGKLAQTAHRVAPIHRMGTTKSKGRSFEISISAPVEQVVIQMAVDFDVIRP